MADQVTGQDVQEIVSLAAMLETPNEQENADDQGGETEGTTGDTESAVDTVADAAANIEQQIDTAKAEGATKEEISELRSMLRELRNDNISLKARLAAAERVQKGDFGTDGAQEEVTELETYQAKLQEAAARDFSQLVAVMEVNPKYADMAEVCTNNNFQDIFDRVATYRSSQNGSDFNVELVKAQAEVWSMPNPYKYMYETIKKYHPAYAEKEVKPEAEKVATPTPKTAKEVIKKTPVTAPASVAQMGGGAESQGGWTAERIDNMPEAKLHTVPRDVYKKWLAGELD